MHLFAGAHHQWWFVAPLALVRPARRARRREQTFNCCFGAGIFVALLLTPEQRHFSKKWIWLGGLIAFAIALPNIFWQVRHHWATYELLINIAHSHKNVVLIPRNLSRSK